MKFLPQGTKRAAWIANRLRAQAARTWESPLCVPSSPLVGRIRAWQRGCKLERHMQLLPGLRPAGPTIEAPRPAARDVVDLESERFEERLSRVREQQDRMNESSRDDESISVARPGAAYAKDPEQRSEALQVEEVADAKQSSAAPLPVETENAQATGPQPSVEGEPAERTAVPSAATPPVTNESGSSEVAVPAPGPSAAATLGTGAMGAGLAAGVQPQPLKSSPELDATGAVPGVAAEPALEAGLLARNGEVSTSTVSDALARVNLSSVGAPHEAPRDPAQMSEAAQFRSLRADHLAAANESAAEILRQVRIGLSADLREANIQLAPEALGRVSIRLRIENGALSADVRAESAQALRALELHAPELKSALAQHGIEPRTLVFSFMNSHAGDAPGRGHASASRSPRAGFPSVELAPVAIERALARRLSASGVDTYA